jgi:hypothetical protein
MNGRDTIVEVLLNTLEAERYVKKPLLATIVDELATSPRMAPALGLASAILERLEGGSIRDEELASCISELRDLVRGLPTRPGLADPPASGVRARVTSSVDGDDQAADAA